MTNLVDDTALNFGLWKDRMNRVLEASQPINAGNEDVLDATRL